MAAADASWQRRGKWQSTEVVFVIRQFEIAGSLNLFLRCDVREVDSRNGWLAVIGRIYMAGAWIDRKIIRVSARVIRPDHRILCPIDHSDAVAVHIRDIHAVVYRIDG